MLTRERMRELIEEQGLSRVVDQIMADSRPCIRLKLDYTPDETIPVGASKVGGSPDVPEGFMWPVWNSVPLMFIAQIRLSEAKSFDEENLLPESGLLYFFFDQEAFDYMPYEATLGTNGPYKVIYLEDERTPLARMSHPSLKKDGSYEIYEYEAAVVSFEQDLSPFFEYPLYYANGSQAVHLTLSEEEKANYMNFWIEAQEKHPQPFHQLLGYEEDAQGIFQATINAHAAWRIGEPEDWILLFQVDSDGGDIPQNRPNFLWGDTGLIHYCINKNDLRACNFDRVWLDCIGT